MRVLERFVILGPQLVRILSSSPSTVSCSGHPTRDVHPEPAEGLFSHSELSATGCRPAALCVLLTPLAASLTQKQGGAGYWSYQFSRGHQTEQTSPASEGGRYMQSLPSVTTHPLLLHYSCSRIEPHCTPPTQEGFHANSLHSMDRRAEIPRHQPVRARGAV